MASASAAIDPTCVPAASIWSETDWIAVTARSKPPSTVVARSSSAPWTAPRPSQHHQGEDQADDDADDARDLRGPGGPRRPASLHHGSELGRRCAVLRNGRGSSRHAPLRRSSARASLVPMGRARPRARGGRVVASQALRTVGARRPVGSLARRSPTPKERVRRDHDRSDHSGPRSSPSWRVSRCSWPSSTCCRRSASCPTSSGRSRSTTSACGTCSCGA